MACSLIGNVYFKQTNIGRHRKASAMLADVKAIITISE